MVLEASAHPPAEADVREKSQSCHLGCRGWRNLNQGLSWNAALVGYGEGRARVRSVLRLVQCFLYLFFHLRGVWSCSPQSCSSLWRWKSEEFSLPRECFQPQKCGKRKSEGVVGSELVSSWVYLSGSGFEVGFVLATHGPCCENIYCCETVSVFTSSRKNYFC